ncbi:MAG: thioredoxin domain-containing protein [Chloroflexi bacterium]|nr:thioredoxin domain-containing protein [Chloroflexota bacterium]
MDETTYSDPRVIALITSRFIPVRVDNDTRPDINARYNMGGWPTTAFLDEDGEVLAGLTYIPPDRMLELLNRVNEAWHTRRDEVRARVADVRRRREEREQAPPEAGALDAAIVERIRTAVDAAYDAAHGGFGDAPKFPHADALRLLVRAGIRDGDAQALARARFTFQQMAGGGTYDHVEGGFFRYSTTSDWSVPHFEKMSEDHGGLLLALAELALASPEDRAAALAIVEPTLAYLDRTLAAPDGGFYGSQDADEAYFALDAGARAQRDRPYVDPRVYASWTAGLARAHLVCGVSFDRSDWIERGTRAVDFVWSRMRAGAAGIYRYYDGTPHLLGLLGDQSAMALALLDAYEVTGDPVHLDRARQLARLIDERWRAPGGACFDVARDHEQTGLLGVRTQPLADNAEVAEAFMRIARLTHDEYYFRVADETLRTFATTYEHYGLLAAAYALAVDRLVEAEPEITVIGTADPDIAPRTRALHAAALRLPLLPRTVQRLEPGRDDVTIAQLDLPRDREAVAYVCVGQVCSAPVGYAGDLWQAVAEARSAPAY